MSVVGNLFIGVSADAAGVARGFKQGLSLIGGFAAQVKASFTNIFAGLSSGASLSAFAEQEEAVARLDAVLAATGNTAGLTSQEIQQVAGDLQNVTRFADEATVAAASVLATFTQIRGDNFRAAIGLAQDLSTVMGVDLQSAVKAVGKALNDPVAGLTSLGKMGVQFSEQQKDLIKTLVETGDVAAAQAVILEALSGKFGGAAAADAQTFRGQLDQMKNAVGEVAETIGGMLAPGLNVLVQGLKAAATWLQANKDLVVTVSKVVLAAVGAVAAYRGALLALTLAQKAVAVGQALIQALSGPAGWAALAAGAALFAGALGTVEMAFNAVGQAAGNAGGGLEAFKAARGLDDEAIKEWRGADQLLAEGKIGVEGHGEIEKGIRERAAARGKEAKAAKELQKEFDKIRDQNLTPFEKVKKDLAEVDALVKKGLGAGVADRERNRLAAEFAGLDDFQKDMKAAIADPAKADLGNLVGQFRDMRDAAEKLADLRPDLRIELFGEPHGQIPMLEAMIDQLEQMQHAQGFADAMADLDAQLTNVGLSAEEVEIFKLAEKFRLTGEEVAGLLEKLDELEDAKAATKLFEESRTPLEQFETRMQELREMLGRGAIDQDLFNRGAGAAFDQLGKGSGIGERPRFAEAISAGSREWANIVNRHEAGGTGGDRDPAAILKEIREQHKAELERLKEIAEALQDDEEPQVANF